MSSDFDDDDDDEFSPFGLIEEIKSGRLSDDLGLTRAVSVRTYRTSRRFDKQAILDGLSEGTLGPKTGFGRVEFLSSDNEAEVRVILARQEETRLRTFDATNEVVKWWSLQRTIVATMAVRYVCDPWGYIRFTTFGGGRIGFKVLETFHWKHLGIEKGSSQQVSIDPRLMRERCFEAKFFGKLKAIRARVRGAEYESIDHAAYKSRRFMMPDVKRLQDIRNDPRSVVEAFESVVDVETSEVAETRLRFTVTAVGRDSSIRLNFPHIPYQRAVKNPRAQTRAFYELCEQALGQIVGPVSSSLTDVDPSQLVDRGSLFAGQVATTEHELHLADPHNCERFWKALDLAAEPWYWLPHLRAIDRLIGLSDPMPRLDGQLDDLVAGDPWQAALVLRECRRHSLVRLGGRVASALARGFDGIADARFRAEADKELLEWALEHNPDGFDVEPDQKAVLVSGRRLRLGLIEAGRLHGVLLACAGSQHRRMVAAGADAAGLQRLDWSLRQLAKLPNDERAPQAARWLSAGRVPIRTEDAATMFAGRVTTGADVERLAWIEADLPLWPRLEVRAAPGGVVVTNTGLGVARAFAAEDETVAADLEPGASTTVAGEDRVERRARFDAHGRVHSLLLPIVGVANDEIEKPATSRAVFSRAEQTDIRRELDPKTTVVGSHDALFLAFEKIDIANRMHPLPHVLIIGESGTGKTHFAKILHRASARARGAWVELTGSSASAGGDDGIIRADWVGIAPKSGLANAPPEGRTGHLATANGGTVFIDDFEVLPEPAQHLLLAAMDHPPRTVQGHGVSLTPDVRVVLATNHDVDELIKTGRIRADFQKRVGLTLRLPPLRERPRDILPLARSFLRESGLRLSPEALLALLRYDWPGNIRELRQCLDSAVAGHLARVARRANENPRAAGPGVLKLDLFTSLPAALHAAVEKIPRAECQREVWTLAAELATAAGARPGLRHGGHNQAMAELMGVDKALASRMYRRHVLGHPDVDDEDPA